MFSYVGITEARFLLGCVAASCLCDLEHRTVYFLMIPFSCKKRIMPFKFVFRKYFAILVWKATLSVQTQYSTLH